MRLRAKPYSWPISTQYEVQFMLISRFAAGQVESKYLLHPQYSTRPKTDDAPGHRLPRHLLVPLAKQRNSSIVSCLSPPGYSTIYMHIQQCGNNKANLADSYSCLQLLLAASRDAGSRKHSLPGQTGALPLSCKSERGAKGVRCTQ